jgi:hypothetical protein
MKVNFILVFPEGKKGLQRSMLSCMSELTEAESVTVKNGFKGYPSTILFGLLPPTLSKCLERPRVKNNDSVFWCLNNDGVLQGPHI